MIQGGKSDTKFRLIVILCAALCTINVHAGNHGFSADHLSRFITIEENLPSNFIDDILMDDSGFIWLATSGGGLCRYDGYDFITFTTNTKASLKNNFVRNIATDSYRRIWIATEGGLDVLDLERNRMIDLKGTALETYESTPCSHIETDAQGSIWAKFDTKLIRISFDEKGNIVRTAEMNDQRLLPYGMVFEDVEANGTVWIGLAGQIYRIAEGIDGGLSASPILSGLSYREDAVINDFMLKENEAWIATNDGLYRYELSNGRWKQYTYDPSDPKSLSQNFITALAITKEKQLLISSLKGLNIYNPLEDGFERISYESSDGGSQLLSSDFINCIRIYDEKIWIGTENEGLIQLYPRELSVLNLANSPSERQSLSPNPVNAIYQDEKGRMWIGTVESGLSISSDEWDGFIHITNERNGLSHNSISAITADDQGMIWAGTWGGGIDIFSPLPPFSISKSLVKNGASNDRISYIGSLILDRTNRLMWIGANQGVYYYDLESGELHSALENQTSGCIGAAIDNKNKLWMGCQDGVIIFDLNSRNLSRTDNAFSYKSFRYKLDNPESRSLEKICYVYKTEDGTIWLGSNGNGIYKVSEDKNGYVFTNYSEDEGLANGSVKGIVEDRFGNLWVSTANGLSRFSPSGGRFSSFYTANGLSSNQFYWNAALRSDDGKLYFGHNGGMSIVNPEESVDYTGSSSIHFTQISIGDKVNHNPYLTGLRLHERDRAVTIEFAALSYAAASTIRYRYRMDSDEESWNELPSGRHYLSFPSIRHGKYLLQVEAMDESGERLATAQLPIKVRAYFYHTFWFYLMIILSLLAGAARYQKHKLKNLVRQREELQRTVEERTREISEQKKLIEEKAEALDRQNKILTRQNEELAGHRILAAQENRPESDTPRDEKVVNKALEVLRENYKNTELDVAFFCTAMGMSKTLLNKKLQDGLGQSIGQLIRTYRLSIAREMLVNNIDSKSMNISEIAYETGFNDPKYFTRCFTKEFGVSPSSYMKS